jgi:hypothetical protein
MYHWDGYLVERLIGLTYWVNTMLKNATHFGNECQVEAHTKIGGLLELAADENVLTRDCLHQKRGELIPRRTLPVRSKIIVGLVRTLQSIRPTTHITSSASLAGEEGRQDEHTRY